MGAYDQRDSAGIGALSSPPRHVGVTRLAVTDFRNYRTARLDLETGPVVLTGPNGAGKTNLLEAVSLLSPGRGLRNAKLSDFDRRADNDDNAAWAVAATIENSRGPILIGTGRDVAGGERRVVRIDGETARGQAALGEVIGITWLTPQMDQIGRAHV